MKPKIVYPLALIALAAMVAVTLKEGTPASAAKPNGQPAGDARDQRSIAALGRVEPCSEEVRIGSEVAGKLSRALVREGQHVHRGELLAVLENRDLQALLISAQARVTEKEAELRRLHNGARPQERAEAWANVKETDAVLESARAEAQRRGGLLAMGAISREEGERADRALGVAAARSDAARQHFELVDGAAREEDIARAQAALQWARSEVSEANARLAKTEIRSPIDGVVLRRHLKPGESVAPSPDMPIFTLGDTSRLRVRADVDESDVGKIRIGQTVRVNASAFHGRFFTGRVVSVGQTLGKKNLRTDRAAEHSDADILEVLIELDDNRTLRPGLRVDVLITTV
jgi:HlyD family secretion protein